MKKTRIVTVLTIIALTFVSLTPALHSLAASAGVIGEYRYTDIETIFYHSPITSYDINGNIVIDAEILNWHYGFDVYWIADTRTLEITDKGGTFNSLQAMSGELVESNGDTGSVAGYYYTTDIIVTLNGSPISGYNMGGRVFIPVDSLIDFGYTVVWDNDVRKITIEKPIDLFTIETDFGEISSRNNYQNELLFFDQLHRGVILETSLCEFYEFPLLSGYLLSYNGVSLVRLADVCDAIDAVCAVEKTMVISNTEWVNGISYDEEYYEYTIDLKFKKNGYYSLFPLDADCEEVETTVMQPDESCYKINTVNMCINGEYTEISSLMGGHEYAESIFVIDGIIYIPTYMTAKILALYLSAR